MIINKSGTAIRTSIADIRVMGRATQGVKLIDITKRNDEISSVCSVISDSEEEEITENLAETDSLPDGETPNTEEKTDSEKE